MTLNKKSRNSNTSPVQVNIATPNVEVVDVGRQSGRRSHRHNNHQFDLYKMAQELKERKPSSVKISPETLLDFYAEKMRWLDGTSGEMLSADELNSAVWRDAIKGRITQNYVHSAAVTTARHTNEFLVSKIVGCGGRVTRSETMRQNFALKEKVIASIKKVWEPEHNVEQCGLFMMSKLPVFAATADAITEHYVFKVLVRLRVCRFIPNSHVIWSFSDN